MCSSLARRVSVDFHLNSVVFVWTASLERGAAGSLPFLVRPHMADYSSIRDARASKSSDKCEEIHYVVCDHEPPVSDIMTSHSRDVGVRQVDLLCAYQPQQRQGEEQGERHTQRHCLALPAGSQTCALQLPTDDPLSVHGHGHQQEGCEEHEECSEGRDHLAGPVRPEGVPEADVQHLHGQ